MHRDFLSAIFMRGESLFGHLVSPLFRKDSLDMRWLEKDLRSPAVLHEAGLILLYPLS